MPTPAGNDLDAPSKKSFFALKHYQYNLLTGLYMLDPWERNLFSEFFMTTTKNGETID